MNFVKVKTGETVAKKGRILYNKQDLWLRGILPRKGERADGWKNIENEGTHAGIWFGDP